MGNQNSPATYIFNTMKLYLFFLLIDLLIILAYPFIFIASKVRKYIRKTLA